MTKAENRAVERSSKKAGDTRGEGASQAREETVLLSSTPAWLNWAAVTLAVLIVAGVFLLSARQLSHPPGGVNAGQMGLVQAGVGGMELQTDATPLVAADATDETAPLYDPDIVRLHVEPGAILVNPGARVTLFADTDSSSSFLDSYARGGIFEVMEPSGDYEIYPVVVGAEQWVRVRAADGLVGWAQAEGLHAAP